MLHLRLRKIVFNIVLALSILGYTTSITLAAIPVELNEIYSAQGLLNAYNNDIDWDYKILAYLERADRGRPDVTTYEAYSMNGMSFAADQNGQGFVSNAYILAPDSFSRGNIQYIAYNLLCEANFYGSNWTAWEHPSLYNEELVNKMRNAVDEAMKTGKPAHYANRGMERYYLVSIVHVENYWLISVAAAA